MGGGCKYSCGVELRRGGLKGGLGDSQSVPSFHPTEGEQLAVSCGRSASAAAIQG